MHLQYISAKVVLSWTSRPPRLHMKLNVVSHRITYICHAFFQTDNPTK
uniref:Uncharacterized protein n=1 Tax=Anguilla anguilla TaxID=7936 RepID=A0A0E9R5H9_ANGAN